MADDEVVTYSELSRRMADLSLERGRDWSGVPVPVEGLNLVLEPRNPFHVLTKFRWKECWDDKGTHYKLDDAPEEPAKFTVINSWFNCRYRLTVYVTKEKDGRIVGRFAVDNPMDFAVRGMAAAAVWSVSAELKAQVKLSTLIKSEHFETYVLTGYYLETSKRSDVTYVFRRGRPTVAIKTDGQRVRGLCALCLHPIGYYDDTWAGVLCPTDEVIAHLLMMRGCEEKFWANANQHPLHDPRSGV